MYPIREEFYYFIGFFFSFQGHASGRTELSKSLRYENGAFKIPSGALVGLVTRDSRGRSEFIITVTYDLYSRRYERQTVE